MTKSVAFLGPSLHCLSVHRHLNPGKADLMKARFHSKLVLNENPMVFNLEDKGVILFEYSSSYVRGLSYLSPQGYTTDSDNLLKLLFS